MVHLGSALAKLVYLPQLRIRPLLLFVLICLSCLSPRLALANEAAPLRFLGNENYKPLLFRVDDAPVGLTYDLATAIFEAADLRAEVELMNWSQAQNIVKQGEADGLIQINKSPERLKIFDFTAPVLQSEFSIFSASDNFEISQFSHLAGQRVGSEAKGYARALLERDPAISIVTIPSWEEGFRMISRGELDALVTEKWVGEYVLSESGIKGIKVSPFPVEISTTHIAVPKGRTDLVGALNTGIQLIEESGRKAAILGKWRGEAITYLTRESIEANETRKKLIVVMAVMLFALILLVGAVLNQRRRLRQKSRELALLNEGLEKKVFERTDLLSRANAELHETSDALRDKTKSLEAAVTVRDQLVSELKIKSNELYKTSIHDASTGLLNTLGLKMQTPASSTSVLLPGFSGSKGAAFFVRLRNVDEIKRQLSHKVAAEYLRNFSDKLLSVLPQHSVVASTGENTYCVLVTRADIASVRQVLEGVIGSEISIGDLLLPIEGTLVLVVYGEEMSLEDLLNTGSDTLNEAIKLKRTFFEYLPGIADTAESNLKYASQILRALENDEFELYFQPKVLLEGTSLSVVGAEALVRWNHPEEGLLSPARFIDIVEASSSRQRFTRGLVQEAAKASRRLRDLGHSIPISINFSGYDSADLKVMSVLYSSIAEFGLEAGDIEIEMLETETSVELETIARSMGALRELGVSIAIDDFGTGQSSLAYLANLPVDAVKIDRSLVSFVDQSDKKQAVLEAVKSMSERFGWKLVAEGVEREEELALCRKIGIHMAQGYLFSPPVPLSNFIEFIASSELEVSHS